MPFVSMGLPCDWCGSIAAASDVALVPSLHCYSRRDLVSHLHRDPGVNPV